MEGIFMERTAAFRRFQERKAKNAAKHKLNFSLEGFNNDPKIVGRFAHTPAPYSCAMCGNHRHHLKGKERLSISERKSDIDFKEELNQKNIENE